MRINGTFVTDLIAAHEREKLDLAQGLVCRNKFSPNTRALRD